MITLRLSKHVFILIKKHSLRIVKLDKHSLPRVVLNLN